MSAADVQTMGSFGDTSDDGPVALKTPLYLLISLVGVFLVACAFFPWAGIKIDTDGEIVGGPTNGFISSVTGLEAGGWGLGVIIAGIAIAALGVLGYFWNPFSDPEAMFIAGFGLLVVVAALLKIADPASLLPDAGEFDSPNVSSRLGLWLVLIAGLDASLSAVWILLSRPMAQVRLT